MRPFRVLSHQPLAAWTLILTLLGVLVLLGVLAGKPPVTPKADTVAGTPVQAQDLLAKIATMHAAVAGQTFDRWLDEFTELAHRGTTNARHPELWQNVIDAAERLADPTSDTPTEMFDGRQRLVTAVFALNREHAP